MLVRSGKIHLRLCRPSSTSRPLKLLESRTRRFRRGAGSNNARLVRARPFYCPEVYHSLPCHAFPTLVMSLGRKNQPDERAVLPSTLSRDRGYLINFRPRFCGVYFRKIPTFCLKARPKSMKAKQIYRRACAAVRFSTPCSFQLARR